MASSETTERQRQAVAHWLRSRCVTPRAMMEPWETFEQMADELIAAYRRAGKATP